MQSQKIFSTKVLTAVFITVVLAVFSWTSGVYAQNALPSGGDSLETAVEIQPGIYQAGELADGVEVFYSIQGKAGQAIKVKGVFEPYSVSHGTNITIAIYNEDKEEIISTGMAGCASVPPISWLSNSEQDVYKYYIMVANVAIWGIESYTLDISFTDRYDAGSQTDAGDSFEKAMSISPGEHEAYLSGREGADTKDFYKLSVKKGEILTVKVTPPSEAEMEVIIYDNNRKVLKDSQASNPGEIVTNSLSITKSEDIFVAVPCDEYCSEELVSYALNVAVSGKGIIPILSLGEGQEKKKFNIITLLIILGIIAAIGLALYFILRGRKKPETSPLPSYSGSKEAHKPTVGYKHPCKYCGKLIPPNSNTCPYCGKVSPLGPFRCPKCHEPVEKDWAACSRCHLPLRIVCPKCGKVTFFGDYCEDCGARLTVVCPFCGQEQPPISDQCIKCGRPLKS